MLGPPICDALRERGPHARQSRDLHHVGAVEIDALAGKERAGQLGGATRRLLQPRTARRGRRLEADVARRGRGRGRKEVADAGTGESESGKEKGSTAVIHRDNLCHPLRTTASKKRV
jgi:hypothetical protein